MQLVPKQIRWRSLFYSPSIAAIVLAISAIALSGGSLAQSATSGISSTLSWNTPFGPGGAEVTELPDLAQTEGESKGMTRLAGAVFPENGREILFIGTHHEGEPPLDPTDLLDAFVVSFRALEAGQAPGVSIEPSKEQLARRPFRIEENDLMPIEYIGGDEHTVVGLAAFEADRVMKSLSLGKDNITKRPFSSRVPGYRSHLDMMDGSEAGDPTRFWIEQAKDNVTQSRDGRTFLIEPELIVRVKAMVVENLVDKQGNILKTHLVDKGRATPSARKFASHMTRHYKNFAEEFPVFHELLTYAAVVSLAEAVRPADDQRPRPKLDKDWLMVQHRVKPVETPSTTPATINRSKRAFPTARRGVSVIPMLSGGVDLTPHNVYRLRDRTVARLQRDVLARVQQQPNRHQWTVKSGRNTYKVFRKRFSNLRLRVWQTDLRLGPLKIVRELGRPGRGPAVGSGWSIRIPSVELASERVQFEGLGSLERYARVHEPAGQVAMLSNAGQFQIPGQPSVFGYASTGRKRKVLHLFKNKWIYFDGEVEFFSINDGPIQQRIPSDVQIIDFSAKGQHLVESVRTSSAQVEYVFRANRLTRIRDRSGRHVDLLYDGKNQVTGLRASDGRLVDYRLGRDGYLEAVVDKAGNVLSYDRHPGTVETTGIRAQVGKGTVRQETRATFEVSNDIGWAELKKASKQHSDDARVFIGIRHAPAGSKEPFEVEIAGKTEPEIGRKLTLFLRQAQIEGYRKADPKRLRKLVAQSEKVIGRDQMVIVGPKGVREETARALQALFAGLRVSGASDLELAVKNLSRTEESGYQFFYEEAGLAPVISEQLSTYQKVDNEGGGVVIVAGHNSSQLGAKMEYLGERGKLTGKTVLLLTCGVKGDGLPSMAISYGANEVLGFRKPIDAKLLPQLVKHLTKRIEENKAKKENHSQMFQEVIQEVLDEVRKSKTKESKLPELRFENLELWFDRVGHLPGTQHSSVVVARVAKRNERPA